MCCLFHPLRASRALVVVLINCLRFGAMEDEAARPLRSSEQLEARMCELKRLVASELLSADDVTRCLKWMR